MLSLLRRRPKITLLVVLLAIVCVYIVYCLVVVAKARSFRKHPDRLSAMAYFKGNLPHNILARVIIFKHGSSAYDTDLLGWAYQSKLISDTFWNKWILESNIQEAPDEERPTLLSHYPLTPTTRLIPLLKKALDAEHYQVLPVLGRADLDEAPTIYRTWVKEKIVQPHNAKLFVAASGYIAQSGTVSLAELLSTFWPQIEPKQRQLLLIKIAAHLPDDPAISKPLLDWSKSTLFQADMRHSCSSVFLTARFLSLGNLRDETLALIGQNASKIPPDKADLLLHFISKDNLGQTAAQVLDRMKDQNKPSIFSIIHHVAHQDIIVAEHLAAPFLSAPDSEVKKGVIVILVRHGSSKGQAVLDEAFTGPAPRKTMFIYSDSYEKGNAPADLYSKLATHDYRQTGKTWPPSYFGQYPNPKEVSDWKQFINTYPWFPGTDDAYYRLAFSEFAQEDYSACLATIKEYFARDYWPDDDARPYMMHLLRNLALVSDVADNDFPVVRHIRVIARNPLALMLIGGPNNVDSVIESIDWFIANPSYTHFLNSDVRTLSIMREVAELIRTAPSDSVCRLVAARLENEAPYPSGEDSSSQTASDNDEVIEETDQDDHEVQTMLDRCAVAEQTSNDAAVYPASIVQSVLYGMFNDFPGPKESSAELKVPSDPSIAAIQQVAAFLNEQLGSASLNRVNEDGVSEFVALGFLHSGKDFDKWHSQFGPAMNFLSALNGPQKEKRRP